MAGLDWNPPAANEREDAQIWAHNRRAGAALFLVYLVFYGGFMALSAFSPEVMSRPFLRGVNLAVIYGFALIVAALVLALVYMKICRKSK